MFTQSQKKTFIALMRTGIGENMAVLKMGSTRSVLSATLATDKAFEDEFNTINASYYEECKYTLLDVALKGDSSPRADELKIKLSKDYMWAHRSDVRMRHEQRQARFDRHVKRKQLKVLFEGGMKPDRPDLSVLSDEEAEFFHMYYDRLLSGEEPDPNMSARYLKLSQKIASASPADEEEEQ